ncbi:MAG: hypothetical protein HYS22_04970 [Deltaproteobacteria bacterium]|nr:hypothetical protein [Deltaproteobacteria bacterium]
MLRFFFNRSSGFVRFLETLGVVEAVILLQLFHWREGLTVPEWLFLFLLFQSLLMKVCDLIHWYPEPQRTIGIEVHFKKAMVAIAYILSLSSSFILAGIFLPAVIIGNLSMMVFTVGNVVLLWLHFHDKEELPINWFTLNRHLKEEKPAEESVTSTQPSRSPA